MGASRCMEPFAMLSRGRAGGRADDLWKAHTLWWQMHETSMVADDQCTKELFTTQSYAAEEPPHDMYSVRVRMDVVTGEPGHGL